MPIQTTLYSTRRMGILITVTAGITPAVASPSTRILVDTATRTSTITGIEAFVDGTRVHNVQTQEPVVVLIPLSNEVKTEIVRVQISMASALVGGRVM
ncbi:hypothetical protein MYCTH_2295337 [Thermothelomyces thermophilus ATCC 42464]|uniref:Uncharacterized protein n=1 Tax=Thermothelomyces thermophilus (strain ATCC 42464 / BCRC 31852 / DSM 1799) TaxID=573729 RepID=G2Q4I1_THET4|nr:uncharacterized protein MYCTH_2295337 [Thermothelomyces thermophilus ATCC 42464]AEO53674.1 hypothetical protein MYCTH_2295337 [Thermothelomyces thermophilus ATCC 42464]